MNARVEQRAGDFGVILSRDGEAHRVDPTKQRAPIRGVLDGMLRGDGAGVCLVTVTDGKKSRGAGVILSGERGVDARVLSSEVADADHSGA